jgi:hypothetical protein
MIFSIASEAIVANGITTTIADIGGVKTMIVMIVAVMTTMMIPAMPQKQDAMKMMTTIFDIGKVVAIAMSMKTMTIETMTMTNRSATC